MWWKRWWAWDAGAALVAVGNAARGEVRPTPGPRQTSLGPRLPMGEDALLDLGDPDALFAYRGARASRAGSPRRIPHQENSCRISRSGKI